MEVLRFREITLGIYFCLAVFAILRKERSSFAGRWSSRFHDIAGARRFFPLMAGSMLVLYVLAALTQHLSFNTYSHDFSMMDEAIYNSHSGQFMFSPVLGGNFFGEHFQPILIFLVPLHFILKTPYLLVFVQPAALWLSVLVLRKLLVREGLSDALANFACLIYLNNPVMISTLNYLFHAECFLPLIIFGMFWYCGKKTTWKYWLMVFLGLMVKEDVGLYMLGFSAYLAVADRRYKLGIATALISVLWVTIALKLLIPYFGGGEGYKFLARWAYWGSSPADIMAGYFKHPLAFIKAIFAGPYVWLFFCMMFMPFYRKWGWLIFLVPWVINSTSSSPLQAKMSIYYGIPVLAFAVLSAVVGFRTAVFRRLSGTGLVPYLVCVAVVLNLSYFTFPAMPRGRGEFVKQLNSIPKDAPAQVMSCFYPAAGYERNKVLLMPGQALTAEYVVIREDSTTWPFSEREAQEMIKSALDSGRYENLSEVKGFFILRRVPGNLQ